MSGMSQIPKQGEVQPTGPSGGYVVTGLGSPAKEW